ncbi:MAG TPA: cellulose synthase subunit BcsC-related outer membrane protein [Rhodopila sp.]|uniref:cellulose biosynthesis protein BcsC n=1 Tax=Rhodopila sp. TaxID=2480087 RepID=UPI002C4680EA|nr:cellulose synthase subunit BcsC-related outer membrane protein [Rhodopila sp.]HVY13836.1 cellulose synthase subunit BcsC-related outer membrane protein [Rhodopila sp.]
MALTALLVATTTSLAWERQAEAQSTTRVAAQSPAAGPAIQVLLDQANFWYAQNRPDDAERSLSRLLSVSPENTDAIALLAQIEASRGDRARAQENLAKLRRLRPDDPRIPRIEQAIRVGSIDANGLAEARRLAQEGHNAEAIARYRGLFQGEPPRSLAVEYYTTLAGTEGGWASARSGLAQVVTTDPADLSAQLAYAELLTYREQTRPEGIRRLAMLARSPAMAAAANKAWRQALDWLPVDSASIPDYQAWLGVHPDDRQIAGKLDQAKNPPSTPADEAAKRRSAGFAALNAGHLSDADDSFQRVLAQNPQDADALGGLGLVRLRQGKVDEARTLLSRAIAADPLHKERWEQALQGASVGEDYAAARAAVQHGQYDAAERQLRAIIARGGDVTGAQLMLADVLARRGRLADAEVQYRGVLARQPNNGDALVGLAQTLNREGKAAEAEALFDRAQTGGNARLVGRIRADALRQQASTVTDPAAKEALLRAASAADPTDPWIRLDLARALAANGRRAEARQVMSDLTTAPNPSVDALRAAAMFAAEDNRPSDAVALINRLPAAARTSEMRGLLAQAKLQSEIRDAVGLSGISPAAARSKLLTLAAQPDPDGSRGVAVARAFLQMNYPAGAREALTTAQAATPNPTSAQRIAYAGVLLQAGDERAAQVLIQSLDGSAGLTPDQRSALNRLRAGVAIREADALNEQHRQADAYDVLAPALERDPSNPELNLAVSRLFAAADQPRRALAISDAVLAKDPNNFEARRAALDAAIAVSDWTRASTLVQGALATAPEDPRSWMLSATLDRARGNPRRAYDDLKHAQSLRRQEIGADQATAPQSVPGYLTDQAAPDPMPISSNPFRRNDASVRPGPDVPTISVSAAPVDPTLQDIDRQMASLNEELAPKITFGPSYRSRTGTSGLDRLDEISLPTTLMARPLGRGVLTASATPTFLSAGSIPGDAQSQASFGTGVFPGSQTPGSQHAEGVGLSLAYQLGWLKADVGSSPIGFQEQNLLGGIELSPKLSDNVRLRLTGERRAVTDSVLSYAGTKDPTTGIAWGGVTRTRGHAQLEISLRDANFYVGGGYAVLDGTNVEENHEYEFGAGGSFPVWRGDHEDVRLGLDTVYFAYDKNLRFFTLGQGGYFSPQSYFATLLPIHYTSHGDDLTWSIGGSVGYQTYNEHASPLFPTDPARQDAVLALASSSSTPVTTGYPSKSASGLVGGAEGSIEYHVNGSFILGGEAHYQHAGDWSETVAKLYARYIFDGGTR